ncbi:PqqD family protein [Ancylobacter terrae]|uniref:PqqD family protein n=1 Tax=Ancylobacter sp. sgz301288 TaxID=3342077 RepID=UPI00385BF2C5
MSEPIPSPDSAVIYAPNGPLVISETIDEESLIMHYRTGQYFNCTGSGALLWSAIETGATVEDLAARLVGGFSLAREHAAEVAQSFLTSALSLDLVKPVPERIGALAPAWPQASYAPPVIQAHDDLKDLLLLDPIHEVDEAGWPLAPRKE